MSSSVLFLTLVAMHVATFAKAVTELKVITIQITESNWQNQTVSSWRHAAEEPVKIGVGEIGDELGRGGSQSKRGRC